METPLARALWRQVTKCQVPGSFPASGLFHPHGRTSVASWGLFGLKRTLPLTCASDARARLSLRTGLAAAPGTRALVIDSHRPLHLSNCAESNRDVFVLRDSGEHAPGRSDGVEAFPGIEDCENGGDDDDDVPSAEDEDTEGDVNLGGRNVRPRVDGDSSAAQRKVRRVSHDWCSARVVLQRPVSYFALSIDHRRPRSFGTTPVARSGEPQRR